VAAFYQSVYHTIYCFLANLIPAVEENAARMINSSVLLTIQFLLQTSQQTEVWTNLCFDEHGRTDGGRDTWTV